MEDFETPDLFRINLDQIKKYIKEIITYFTTKIQN